MNPIMRQALGDLLDTAAAEPAVRIVEVFADSGAVTELISKLRRVAEDAAAREAHARQHNSDLAARLRAVAAERDRAAVASDLWEDAARSVSSELQPFFGETALTAHSAVWAAHQMATALDEARDAQRALAAALAPLASLAEGREGMHEGASVLVPLRLLRLARVATNG